jgi:hypothetical protein
MSICIKCGNDKIIVEQGVIGFPDHHVAGTKQEYCGYCDTPPVIELHVHEHLGRIMLDPNNRHTVKERKA